jgi:hypothetical protein
MKAFLAVDKDGSEFVYGFKPLRADSYWYASVSGHSGVCELPKGTIKKIIGRNLTWKDDCVSFSTT